MFVFRIENNDGDGPIYGETNIRMVPFDYRNIDYMKKYMEENPDIDIEWHGLERESDSFKSRGHIIRHKVPRDNHQYLYNRLDSSYSFGWSSLKKAKFFCFANSRSRHVLHEENFAIKTYEIKRSLCMIFPDGQVAFKKKSARVLSGRRLFI